MNNTFLETIKIFNGKVFHLKYHQERYEKVLKKFNIKEFKNLQDYIKLQEDGLYRCRLVYTKDNIDVEYLPYTKRKIKKLKLIYNDKITYKYKSTCRDELNNLFNQREDADDIIIVKNSFITDTTIANIAFYDGEVWHTPKKPLLEGTTRQRFIDDGKLILSDIDVQTIYRYKKIALLNAMIDFDIIAVENIKDIIC